MNSCEVLASLLQTMTMSYDYFSLDLGVSAKLQILVINIPSPFFILNTSDDGIWNRSIGLDVLFNSL